VQVKLQDPLRTCAIPERLRGVYTTKRYTNPRLPYLNLTFCYDARWQVLYRLHTAISTYKNCEADRSRRWVQYDAWFPEPVGDMG